MLALTSVLLPFAVASGQTPAAAYPAPGYVTGDIVVHDPTMVRRPDGRYFVFSTNDGIQIRTSTDRIHFSFAGRVFPNGVSWAAPYAPNTRELWAPDISYHNGQYWLYYSASTFGSNVSAIGLATSPTAEPGTWTDRGMVYSSSRSSDYNAIDPNLFVDPATGRWWLTFGSFWTGIKMIEIDPATGKQAPWNTTRYSLAQRPSSTAIEAPYIVYRNGYYYLFVSFDYCCRGSSSTYRVMVGRSTSVTGPYYDRAGVPMMNGGGTEILASQGNVRGPGHPAVMVDTDQTLLIYHWYDASDGGTPKLGINFLSWDSAGWPYVW